MARAPRSSRAGRSPAGLMMTLRRWHGYVGALIAPSILFFAFSGGLQLFHLHEDHPGYHPPAWAETLGNVHKDQVLEKEEHHGPPGGEKRGPDADRTPPKVRAPSGAELRSYLLKWEFVLVAAGLIGSTSVGLWIALQDPRRRRSTLILLAIGAILPLLTLFA